MPKLNVDLVVNDTGSVVVKKFGGTVNEVFSALGKTNLAGLLGGAGFAALAQQTIGIADNWTQVNGRLRLVTTSAEQLAGLQGDLYRLAQDTRGEYGATADMYARIARSTEQLNKSQQAILQVSKAVNQSLVVSGASTQEAQAAAIQLAQGLASGRLAGDELKSILENSPRLAKAIADGLGVSIGQLREMGSAGELTAEKVFGALQSQAGKINEEFAQMPMTVSQGMGLVGNSVGRMINEINKASGGTSDMAEGLKYASQLIEKMTPAAAALSTYLIGSVKELVTLGGLLPAINRIAHGDPLIDNHLGKDRVALEEQAALQEIAAAQTELLLKHNSKKEAELQKTKDTAAAKVKEEEDYSKKVIKIHEDLAGKIGAIGQSEYEKKKYLLSLEIGEMWNTAKYNESVQQQIMAYGLTAALGIEKAEAESTRKIITSKLDEYNKYYADIQKQIIETHKKEYEAVKAINDLLAQRYSTRRGTESMLGDFGGPQRSASDQYNLSLSELDQQRDAIDRLSGQDKISALDNLKQKLHELGVEFKDIQEGKWVRDAKGKKFDVTFSGQDVAADISKRISEAWTLQKQTMDGLKVVYEQQVEGAKQWGEVLKTSATEANNYIVYLQGTLVELAETIAMMDTAFTVTAQDNSSLTISTIQRALDDLQDKTITITTQHINTYGGGASVLDSHALGTGFIPRTGPYELHYGESVNTAAETKALSAGGGNFKLAAGGGGGNTFGDVVINIPANAAPQRPDDWRRIARDYIIPELRNAGYAR